MKIQKASSSKKILITLLIATLLVAGTGAILGAMNNWWQPKKEASVSTDPKENNDSKEDSTPPPEETPTPPTETSPNPSEQTIIVPPAEKPSSNARFPVENSHYRIDKKSASSYEITLYAVLNNPSQRDEYTAQLRQFKKEALDYMKERFNSISSFAFTWNPPEAKDL